MGVIVDCIHATIEPYTHITKCTNKNLPKANILAKLTGNDDNCLLACGRVCELQEKRPKPKRPLK